MAAPISVAELKKMPVLSYDSVRNTLQTGDLFFCVGEYAISRFIRKITKSTFSHVGIIYKDENLNRIFFLESELFYGVRMAPFSKYFKNGFRKKRPYKGIVVIASVDLPENIDIREAINFGMDELTRPYDNSEVINILLRTMLKIAKKPSDNKYICSEYVAACFKKIGIEFGKGEKSITPKNIWEDSRITFKGRLL